MATTQEQKTRKIDQDRLRDSDSSKIDRNASAGSENLLGAESIRDGRPSSDDSTVEAIDEMGPGITAPLSTDKAEAVAS